MGAHYSSLTEVSLKLACLVRLSLAGQTRMYLASDVQLTTNTGCLRFQSVYRST